MEFILKQKRNEKNTFTGSTKEMRKMLPQEVLNITSIKYLQLCVSIKLLGGAFLKTSKSHAQLHAE